MAKKNAAPNVLVIDPDKGWYLTRREAPPGRRWNYMGRFVHLVRETPEGPVPIEIPDKPGDSPDKLYRALHWPEAKALFSIRATLLEKLNTAASLGLIALLFLCLLIIFGEVGG